MSGSPAPTVSLLLLSYRQRDLLDRAVAAAFAQQGPPIEIVLSDDGSNDGSFERLEELAAAYRGPHRVVVRPRSSNLGIAGHYNALLAFSRGELLVTAAGDDVSAPDRVRRLVEAWETNGRRADLIASHLIDMDAQGGLHDMLRVDDLGRWRGTGDWMRKRPYIVGAGHAFTRRMMERFGPLRTDLSYEDQIMVFRAMAMGGAITVDAPLVHYRRGGASGKPGFASVEQMTRWTLGRLDRERAEVDQLLADAEVADCAERMRDLLDPQIRRDRLLRLLLRRPPWRERWRALREAASLPLGWRLRKLIDTATPELTFRVKRLLQLLHRRTWRARRGPRAAVDDTKGRPPSP
jgi:glycosyltransferase involved in cell wall biosynthesis